MMLHEVIDDDQFYVAVGRIAYSSSRIFEAIEVLIIGLLSEADGCWIITADYTYAQIHHLANALADHLIKGKKELATLTKILDDANRWYQIRNKVMHGEWSDTGSGWYRWRRWRARGKFTVNEELFLIEDLFAVSVGLEECCARLEKFINRKRFEYKTMLDSEVGRRRMAQRKRQQRREQKRQEENAKKASAKRK